MSSIVPAEVQTWIADHGGPGVGRYVLLHRIAEGGMGVVYAAYDSQLDRKVAIKLLRPAVAKGQDAAEVEARLLREAQAMARLSHPNVVAIHDVGVVDGKVFLAMEYVEGGTLKDRIAKPASWSEQLALLKQAGRGLAAAHAAGIVHRDFKPDNVLVGHDDRVRVTDFGIARADVATASSPSSSGLRGPSSVRSPLGALTPPSKRKAAKAARAEGNASVDSGASPVSAPNPPSVPNPSSNPRAASAASAADQATLWVRPPSTGSVPRIAAAPEFAEVATASPLIPPSRSSGNLLSDPLTLTGDLLGTVGYMAPEQALGERVDARSDQFSFCATLHLALYGERPFVDRNIEDYLVAITRPVRDAPAGSKVPVWLRRVLLKGLSLDPAQRFASMDELLAALDHDPATLRRRWLSVGAALLVVLGAMVAYRQGERARSLQCESDEADLAGAWDREVRADVHRAFEATGAVNQADVFARSSRALDAYASAWRAARADACEATKVRHEQSEEVYALRTECLDRDKLELRATTSLLRSVDKNSLAGALKAAYGLTSLAWCADVNALRAAPGLPVEPTKRAAVLEARSALATSVSLATAGKYVESFAEAERARDKASGAGHGGTEAEALYQMGYVRHRMGLYDEASSITGEAMARALATGDDPTFVRAAARLAFIAGDKLYHPAEAARIIALARAGIDRMGGSEELSAEVLATDAVMVNAQGYPERAVPMLERVVGFDRASLGDNPATAIQLNNLGYAEQLAGMNQKALETLEQSHAMFVSLFGIENLTAGIPLCNLGAASLALGRLTDADRYLHRALDVFDRESKDGYWTAWVLQYITTASVVAGDVAEAASYGKRGLAIADKLPSAQRLLAGLAVPTADALLAGGAAAEALGLCERALAVQESVGLVDAARVYDWDALRCRGEALLALGRTAEARASLERTVALPRRVFDWDLPRARFALARAIAGDDRPRALELAQQARDALATMPQGKVFVAEVDAWTRGRTLPSHAP